MTNLCHIATLSNGLRVIHEASASEVVYCGYVVCAGTRHEDEADTGMAHFIEHMSFKGTHRRRAFHIINGLERVGGDLNAFTNKQETVYCATVLRQDFERAADLLTDIVFGSTYPQREIDKEVEVICDEIDSYKDSPAEIIFDEFEAMLFKAQPLGRDILGSAERLRSYTTADALRFAEKYYRPENAIFYVYGQVDFDRAVRVLEKNFRLVAPRPDLSAPLPAALACHCCEGETRVVEKGTHQAHVLLGAPAFGGNDQRRFAMLLLNNLLGGPGMNSRLNLSLREKAGLVYSVDSYLNTYPDTGFWNVYFGCDIHDVERCRKLVVRELQKLYDRPLTDSQLTIAKKQLKGQIGISCDNGEGYALALGKTFAHYNCQRRVENIFEEIDRLTPHTLQEVAAEVYNPERLTTLIYK